MFLPHLVHVSIFNLDDIFQFRKMVQLCKNEMTTTNTLVILLPINPNGVFKVLVFNSFRTTFSLDASKKKKTWKDSSSVLLILFSLKMVVFFCEFIQEEGQWSSRSLKKLKGEDLVNSGEMGEEEGNRSKGGTSLDDKLGSTSRMFAPFTRAARDMGLINETIIATIPMLPLHCHWWTCILIVPVWNDLLLRAPAFSFTDWNLFLKTYKKRNGTFNLTNKLMYYYYYQHLY